MWGVRNWPGLVLLVEGVAILGFTLCQIESLAAMARGKCEVVRERESVCQRRRRRRG